MNKTIYGSVPVKALRNNFSDIINQVYKLLFIFHVWVYESNMKTPYGMSRHDLLGYLVRDIFNYSNILGTQLVEISDVPGIMDSYSSSRVITFKAVQPASLNEGVRTNKYEFGKINNRT